MFVLHSHLPYVLGHGRWPHGTDWLNEAAAETYIPLLNNLFQLVSEGYHPHLTIGITPILAEQLTADSFKKELLTYLQFKIEAAKNDRFEFARYGEGEYTALAEYWCNFYTKVREDFVTRYKGNILNGFKILQQTGFIEVITCAATHGYLPLLKDDRSVEFQIAQGIETYKRHFDVKPAGIWLPECAYRPSYNWAAPVGKYPSEPRKGIDEFLSDSGIDYFITDSHMLKGGKAIGMYLARFDALKKLWEQYEKEFVEIKEGFRKTPYEAYLVASNPQKKPVSVFTRDPKTGLQVWSGEWGYPGDGSYLDFHKKRFPGGLRYWRVTNPKIDLALKEIYRPEVIEEKVKEQARHFVQLASTILADNFKQRKRPGILCAPFDSELFGHWWFEGPRWLYHVLKIIDDEKVIGLATGSEYLKKEPPTRVISLPEGSWGEGGFHYIWLNEWTKWTWVHIYEAEDEFYSMLARARGKGSEVLDSVLRQLARELLLMQSSDWQFLISTFSARDYAEMRFVRHQRNFKRIAGMADQLLEGKQPDTADWTFFKDVKAQDNIFPQVVLPSG